MLPHTRRLVYQALWCGILTALSNTVVEPWANRGI